MLPEDKYFETLTEEELWQRYCGFLDLSIEDFMNIQRQLLMDEINRVADSPLGKKIMGGNKPKDVEEFRHTVPLTSYDDYEPYLRDQKADALAIEPRFWCHSAGRGGKFKWFPHSSEFVSVTIKYILAIFILASAKKRGEVNTSPGFRLLSIMPPPPYGSGLIYQRFPEFFTARIFPPTDLAEEMAFEDRIKLGFSMALKEGVDFIGAIASVLVKMGEQFQERSVKQKPSPAMLNPKILTRMLRAVIRSKKEHRPILPKDLWPAKAVLASGMDTAIYRDDIAYYWGAMPYEAYGCSEAYFLALHSWNKDGLVFLPDSVFLEFIPYEEQLKHEGDKDYRPRTVLMNELEMDKSYEIVITHFYGMPLLRYRMKDVVKVIRLEDKQTGIRLPHVIFQCRTDDVIPLAGLAWLDEKSIWQAIRNTGVKYAEWTACKEYDNNETFLRIYIELKEERDAHELESLIDEQLKLVDTDYPDIGKYLGTQPVKVTVLSKGTFDRYTAEKKREGVDLAHLKPSHINPSEMGLKRLIELSKV